MNHVKNMDIQLFADKTPQEAITDLLNQGRDANAAGDKSDSSSDEEADELDRGEGTESEDESESGDEAEDESVDEDEGEGESEEQSEADSGIEKAGKKESETAKDKAKPIECERCKGKIVLTQQEYDGIIARRVDRAKRLDREQLREKIEEVAGVPLSDVSRDIPEAVKLWTFLKKNPEVTRGLHQKLADLAREQPQIFDDFFASEREALERNQSKKSREREQEVRLARAELRSRDPLFKEFEQDVLLWAETQDYDIASEKDLRTVYLLWKDENKAKVRAFEGAGQAQQRKATKVEGKAKIAQDRKPIPAVGRTARGSPVNIREKDMDDLEILKREGLSLFKR